MCATANCHAKYKCNCKWPWAGNDRTRNKSSSRNFIERHLQVPCVGVSIGIERIFAILEAEADRKKTLVRTTETEVYVATAHKKLHEDRMRIIAKLWDAGRRIAIGIWIVTMSTMSCGRNLMNPVEADSSFWSTSNFLIFKAWKRNNLTKRIPNCWISYSTARKWEFREQS